MLEQLEAIWHFRNRVEVRQLVQGRRTLGHSLLENFVSLAQSQIGVPLAAKRGGKLATFDRVKRLSEKEDLVRGRHLFTEILRLCADRSGDDDDIDVWIDFANLLGCLDPVYTGGHADIEKHD